MTTDFRALCAELAEKLDEFDRLLHGAQYVEHPLTYRARAALAEPQPEPPTDKKLADLYWQNYHWAPKRSNISAHAYAIRAVLARYGNYPARPEG